MENNKNAETSTGREIKVSSNKKTITFTIRNDAAKYRTLAFTREEFDKADRFWTGQDWQNFLKTDNYYKIK